MKNLIALSLLALAPAAFASESTGQDVEAKNCAVTGLTVTDNAFAYANLSECELESKGQIRIGQSSSIGQSQMKETLERALIHNLKVNVSARKISGNNFQIETVTLLRSGS